MTETSIFNIFSLSKHIIRNNMSQKLDVIIFGATGFTGKYTVYQAVETLKGLKWGVAGRNEVSIWFYSVDC